MNFTPEEAENIANEILGKTSYKNIFSKNQFGLLKLLLENRGDYISNRGIADKLKEIGVLTREMDSEIARRQVLKAAKEVEQKLQKYAVRKDTNPEYCFMIERMEGKGIKLVQYKAISNQSTRQLTVRLKDGLIRVVNTYSTLTLKPVDEIVAEALEAKILGDEYLLNAIEKIRATSPMGYINRGGPYIDDAKKTSKKKK